MRDLSRRRLLAGASAWAMAMPAAASIDAGSRPASAKAPKLGTQAPAFYRFAIGEFEATVVSDGPLQIGSPGDGVFDGLTRDDMVRGLEHHFLPTDKVALEQNALVVNTGTHLVLFDTGLGSFDIFGPKTGRLFENLKAAGIEPGDIDVVILTHAHPDHCFGLMADARTPNFPNARIYMAERDLAFWTDMANAKDKLIKLVIMGAQLQLNPNRDRIAFVKDGQEVIPGIRTIATPGHTPGHMSYVISSRGQALCNLGDVVHHHVLSIEYPKMAFAFDTDGAQSVRTRLRMFDMLATERMRFLAYHLPWPGIGHIGRRGDGYRYVPEPMQMTP